MNLVANESIALLFVVGCGILIVCALLLLAKMHQKHKKQQLPDAS